MRTAMLVSFLFVTACAAESGDSSLYLTGTEESYVTNTMTGAKECVGKKELVCHIPPGNPGNAHTICVSKNAVDTHVSHHADTIGACTSEPTPPPQDPPACEDGCPPPDDGTLL